MHFDEIACWNWDLKEVDQKSTILDAAAGETSTETEFDVDGTSDADVLKVRPLAEIYERCNLVHAEPTSYAEAAKDAAWIEAMKSEIDSIKRNQTWSLTVLPHDKKEIGVK